MESHISIGWLSPNFRSSDGTSNINNNPNAIDWYPGNPVIATVLEAWGNFQVQFHSPGATLLDATMPNECAWEYDDSAGDCNCAFYLQVSTQVPAQVTVNCPVPTGETTTATGWDSQELAVHKFVQQLMPFSTSFAGRMVTESDASPATDSCWFSNSPIPKAAGVSGGAWTIGTDNRWGPDAVGWDLTAFSYYQQTRPAMGLPLPCEFRLFQRLTISSCGGSAGTVYRSPVSLRGIISASGASSERAGVLVGRPLIIQ